jgi:hypothetical protein
MAIIVMVMAAERCVWWSRQDMLATPLGLWNHLDIDFAAETEEIVPGSYTKNANKVDFTDSSTVTLLKLSQSSSPCMTYTTTPLSVLPGVAIS